MKPRTPAIVKALLVIAIAWISVVAPHIGVTVAGSFVFLVFYVLIFKLIPKMFESLNESSNKK